MTIAIATRRNVLFGIGSLAFAMPWRVAAADGAPVDAGQVANISGSAIGILNDRSTALAVADRLFIGETISTGGGARAGLLLGNTTSIRMGERARLRIDRFMMDAGGEITLDAGPVLLDKPPGAPERGARIHGAFGLITVRGTQVFVGPGMGGIGVLVTHGLAEVTANGATVVLRDGLGTQLMPGAKPMPPMPWSSERIAASLASVG